FLLLLLWIISGQVGRNSFPGLAVIPGAKQELRADVNRPFFVRRQRDRRIPIESEFFVVVWSRLDIASFVGTAINSRDLAALIFGVNVIRISGVRKHPETIAVIHIFPLVIGDTARIL